MQQNFCNSNCVDYENPEDCWLYGDPLLCKLSHEISAKTPITCKDMAKILHGVNGGQKDNMINALHETKLEQMIKKPGIK